MSFDCQNPEPATTCGRYVTAYIGNMEFVSDGILKIINTLILSAPIVDTDITSNDSSTLCKCLPICPSTGTDKPTQNCLPTQSANIFNCKTWGIIKNALIDESALPDDRGGYLPLLSQTIKCFLEQTAKVNYGFAAQMERFLCLVDSLNTRLDSVCCNNKCPDLVGDLLCLLMQILTKLISTVSKAATLMYYSDCATNVTTGNRVISSFFECMACDFVNDLCELEKLIPEISALVVGFATCDMQHCTPCYTAPSVPRKVRPICPTNAMNYGGGYPYQRQGGCGCSCGCKK